MSLFLAKMVQFSPFTFPLEVSVGFKPLFIAELQRLEIHGHYLWSHYFLYRLLRVFRRNGVHFTQSGAHEHIDPNGRTRELDGDILHYPYKHFREHLDKINSYAQQGADDLAARGKKGGLALGVLHGIGRFLRIYLLKKGFLDGKAGFINAVHGAFYAFLKYVRVDEGNWGFPYNHR